MTKKMLVLTLTVTLGICSLTGCGGAKDTVSSAETASSGGVVSSVGEETTTDKPSSTGTADVSYEPVTLVFQDDDDPSYPLAKASQYLSDYLTEKTGGVINTELHFNAILADGTDAVEALQLGLFQMARMSAGNATAYVPELDIFNLPFLFENEEHFWKVIDGEVGETYEELFEKNGLKLITFYFEGVRDMFSRKECITSVSQLKGQKVRTMGAQSTQDAFSAMGALPVPMNGGEVYSSLSQGVLDACENNYSSIIDHMWHEAAPYFTNTDHLMVPSILLCDLNTWNDLPEETQEIIMEAAVASRDYADEIFNDAEEEAFNTIIESGAEYKELSDEERGEFREACTPLYEQYCSEGIYKEIYDNIISLRSDS